MSGPTAGPSAECRRRTRHRWAGYRAVDPAGFWEGDVDRALAAHGAAARPPMPSPRPAATHRSGRRRGWTLGAAGTPRGHRGQDRRPVQVELDQAAFTDLVLERKTALGLVMAGGSR